MKVETTLSQKMSTRTLFDISSEIDDLPSDRRNEKIGDFFLRTIVATHYYDQQALRGSGRRAKDGTTDEPRMRQGGDQIVQFA